MNSILLLVYLAVIDPEAVCSRSFGTNTINDAHPVLSDKILSMATISFISFHFYFPDLSFGNMASSALVCYPSFVVQFGN